MQEFVILHSTFLVLKPQSKNLELWKTTETNHWSYSHIGEVEIE